MHRILIHSASCVSILLTVAALPADDAPAEPGKLYRDGTLVNERGEPVRGAKVAVFGEIATGGTDAEGRFHFEERSLVELENGMSVEVEITSTNPLIVRAHIDAAMVQGIWSVVSLQNNGVIQEPMKDLRIFIDQNRLTFRKGGKVVDHREYSYALEPGTSPGQIELTSPEGKIPGIYSWDKDRVTLCFNENGPEHPTKFVSVANSRNDLLLVLQRSPETQSLDSVADIDAPENKELKEALAFYGMMDFTGNPLRDVMDYVSEIHKIGVLADPGVDLDVEIQIHTFGAFNLHTALLMLLEPLDLRYVLRDGKIVVTPRATD